MFLAYLIVFLQLFWETQKVTGMVSPYHVRPEFDGCKCDVGRERKLRPVPSTLCLAD